MRHEEKMELLKSIVIGFGKIIGKETEIVLHDLYEGRILYIHNGYITGRDVTYIMNPSVKDTIVDMIDEDGCLIGYGSNTAKGHKIRASHLIIKDDDGNAEAMICVNQDVTNLDNVIAYLGEMVKMNSISGDDRGEEYEDTGETYIQRVTKKAILDAIDKLKPTDINSREGKMSILSVLKAKGIFDVKDAVPYVCNILNVSQATLYNYLRELRSETAMSGIAQLRSKE